MITTAKIALVHVAKRDLRLEEDFYRTLLEATAGVTSAKDLDDAGFDHLMRRFEKLGFTSTARERRQRRPNRTGVVTREQQLLIAANYDLLVTASEAAGQAGFGTTAARIGFNKRQCRKAFPQTVGDAIKVIEGQKKMLDRFAAVQK